MREINMKSLLMCLVLVLTVSTQAFANGGDGTPGPKGGRDRILGGGSEGGPKNCDRPVQARGHGGNGRIASGGGNDPTQK